MAKKYRILSAMLLAPDFTPAELAERAGVKRPTVYSVLRDYKAQMVDSDRSVAPKRGGVTKPQKLTDAGRELVRRELAALTALPDQGAHKEAIPEPIIAAEGLLLNRLPSAEAEAHSETLSLAASLAADGFLEAEESKISELEPTKAHLELTRFLLRLAAAETPGREVDPASALALLLDFNNLKASLALVDEDKLLKEAEQRFDRSPLSTLIVRVPETLEGALMATQRLVLFDAAFNEEFAPCVQLWSKEHRIDIEEIEPGALVAASHPGAATVGVIVMVDGSRGDWSSALESAREIGQSVDIAVIAESPSRAMAEFVATDIPNCTFVPLLSNSSAAVKMAVDGALTSLVGRPVASAVQSLGVIARDP